MNDHPVIAIRYYKSFDFYSKSMKSLADFLDILEINRLGYQTLEKNIRENKWEDVDQFLTSNPAAVSAKITNLGRTALHVAIVAGRDAIVRELLNRTTEENLKIKDNAGLAVLDCCAVSGNKQMAEIIVTKFPALLSIRNKAYRMLPVVLAIWRNSREKEMVRYLYNYTPPEVLKSDNGVSGATFINKCLYAKAFGENLGIEHTFVCYFYVRNLENNSISINYFCLPLNRSGFEVAHGCTRTYYVSGFGRGIPSGGISYHDLCISEWKSARILETMDLQLW